MKDMENNYDFENSFSYLIQGKMQLPDFFIRIDLCCVLAINYGIPVYRYTRNNWNMIFGSLQYTDEMNDACSRYFAKERKLMERISKKVELTDSAIIRVLTIVTVIMKLSESESLSPDCQKIISSSVASLKDIVISVSIIKDTAEEQLKNYFITNGTVSNETVDILHKYNPVIKNVYSLLRSKLNPKEANNPTIPTISARIISPERFIRIMCLMYLAIEEKSRTNNTREVCIQHQWDTIFENSVFVPKESIIELDRDISSDQMLTWVNMLFEYELSQIVSGKIVRMICLSLCVNSVISQLPHRSSHELVEDEALELFSKFYGVSAGYEKNDVEEYVKRLTTIDGTIDDRISDILWKCYKTIQILLKKAINYSNSEDNARKKNKREQLVIEQNKAINELKSQLYTKKANTIFKLIETLTDPTYNYVLDRMYRFAFGYDNPSYDDLRTNIKDLFQILRLFGAVVTNEDIIDCKLTDDLCKEHTINISNIPDMAENHVVFPGWEVLGDTVTFPIAVKKMEE